jgi:FkbM family methyltransferase
MTGSAARAVARSLRGLSPRLYAGLAWRYKRWRGALSLGVVEAFVRPGDVVVDIGANWGFYTHRLAQLVGPAGHVHAIEPDPAMAPSLEAIRNGRPHVTVHQVAVSDRAGTATLHVPVLAGQRIGALASLTIPRTRERLSHETVRVLVERLDHLLPAGGPHPSFIKCDAEGHEPAVLRGAEAILRCARPTLLCAAEARHQDADPLRTFDSVRELGYRTYAVHPDGLRPVDEFDVDRNQRAFAGDDFCAGAMPPGYVQHFLLVPFESDPSASLRAGRPRQ